MIRGLFDDLPRPTVGNPASNQAAKIDTPCTRPANGGPVCRIGKGEGSMSDDGGKTHFCPAHRPAGFYPHERGRA